MEKQTRISYNKEFKSRVLRAFIRGEELKEIFLKYNPDVEKCLKNDKKYILKLVNKWRHKYYLKREELFLTNQILTDEIVQLELQALEKANENNIFDQHYEFMEQKNLSREQELKIQKQDFNRWKYTQY